MIGVDDRGVGVTCIEQSTAVGVDVRDGVDVRVRDSSLAWRNNSINNNRHMTMSGE